MPTSRGNLSRVPLRMRLAEHHGLAHLDGGWWPQSRDLAVELAELVEHLAVGHGRVVRVHCSLADWDAVPSGVAMFGSYVKVSGSESAEAHLIELLLSSGVLLRVLVVPPELSDYHGDEALLASATAHNAETATSLLNTVTEFPGADPADRWSDEGGSWWHPHRTAPSYRVED
ncbi:MAG: DUF5994 family protein [Marmoricola sp.]|jgi:uncharacterized protein DUF5994